MAQRKAGISRAVIRGKSRMKGSWTGPSWTSWSYGKAGKGFQTGAWTITWYGKGFGKQKGLNEVRDWSHYVWDLHGIHALTAVFSQATFAHCGFARPRSIAAALLQLVTVLNRFEVLSLGDEAQEFRDNDFAENDSRDALQDGACCQSVFPHVHNKALKTKLARKIDSSP